MSDMGFIMSISMRTLTSIIVTRNRHHAMLLTVNLFEVDIKFSPSILNLSHPYAVNVYNYGVQQLTIEDVGAY